MRFPFVCFCATCRRTSKRRKHVVDPLLCKPEEFVLRLVFVAGNALQQVVRRGSASDAQWSLAAGATIPGTMAPTAPTPTQSSFPCSRATTLFCSVHEYVSQRVPRFAVQLACPPADLQDVLDRLAPRLLSAPPSGASSTPFGRPSSSHRRTTKALARGAVKLASLLKAAIKADTPYARREVRATIQASIDQLLELKETYVWWLYVFI